MTIVKAVLSVALVAGVTAATPVPPGPRVHLVHLVGYTYDPADIVARSGDTVRFIQESTMPHNVEFTETAPGARLGDARVGPYLIAQPETYDLVLDQRFPPGSYAFLCTPHQTLGMKGTLVVN